MRARRRALGESCGLESAFEEASTGCLMSVWAGGSFLRCSGESVDLYLREKHNPLRMVFNEPLFRSGRGTDRTSGRTFITTVKRFAVQA